MVAAPRKDPVAAVPDACDGLDGVQHSDDDNVDALTASEDSMSDGGLIGGGLDAGRGVWGSRDLDDDHSQRLDHVGAIDNDDDDDDEIEGKRMVRKEINEFHSGRASQSGKATTVLYSPRSPLSTTSSRENSWKTATRVPTGITTTTASAAAAAAVVDVLEPADVVIATADITASEQLIQSADFSSREKEQPPHGSIEMLKLSDLPSAQEKLPTINHVDASATLTSVGVPIQQHERVNDAQHSSSDELPIKQQQKPACALSMINPSVIAEGEIRHAAAEHQAVSIPLSRTHEPVLLRRSDVSSGLGTKLNDPMTAVQDAVDGSERKLGRSVDKAAWDPERHVLVAERDALLQEVQALREQQRVTEAQWMQQILTLQVQLQQRDRELMELNNQLRSARTDLSLKLVELSSVSGS